VSETQTRRVAGVDLTRVVPPVGVFCLYAATIVLALAITPGFLTAGLPHIQNGGTTTDVGVIVLEILVVTGVILAAERFGVGKQLIKLAQYAILVYAFALFVGTFTGGLGVVSVGLGVVASALLWVHHEWYVVDVLAVAFGAAVLTQLGVGLSPDLVLVLLVVMAAYDAFAVYQSEHMQSLVGAIGDLDLPAVFVVPANPSFSLRDADGFGAEDEPVSVLGLGDAIFPGLLVVSAAHFVVAPPVVTFAGLPLGYPALGALVGALLGLVAVNVVLHYWQRMHPALPYINTLTILGYGVGVLAAGLPLTAALGA